MLDFRSGALSPFPHWIVHVRLPSDFVAKVGGILPPGWI
jgi:hypothetical protein